MNTPTPPKSVTELAREQGVDGPRPDYEALAGRVWPDGPPCDDMRQQAWYVPMKFICLLCGGPMLPWRRQRGVRTRRLYLTCHTCGRRVV